MTNVLIYLSLFLSKRVPITPPGKKPGEVTVTDEQVKLMVKNSTPAVLYSVTDLALCAKCLQSWLALYL